MAEPKDPLIFADKIKKEFIFWHKALTIRENYEQMFSKYRTGQLREDELIKLNDFNVLWISISELYGILHYRYLKKLEDKKKVEFDKLTAIMDRYRVKGEKMNFADTSFTVEILQETCSINSFDDVSLDKKEDKELNIEEAFR